MQKAKGHGGNLGQKPENRCSFRVDPGWAQDRRSKTAFELTDRNPEGHGVTVTRFFKQGNVDYKKVPELKVVERDRYRAAGRVEVRVTVAK